MSLTEAERKRTSNELRLNLERSGLTRAQASADLGLSTDDFERILSVRGADPSDVWLLRDYLEQAVRDAGGQPAPYTVLTESGRAAAAGWFGLRTAPRHDFTA